MRALALLALALLLGFVLWDGSRPFELPPSQGEGSEQTASQAPLDLESKEAERELITTANRQGQGFEDRRVVRPIDPWPIATIELRNNDNGAPIPDLAIEFRLADASDDRWLASLNQWTVGRSDAEGRIETQVQARGSVFEVRSPRSGSIAKSVSPELLWISQEEAAVIWVDCSSSTLDLQVLGPTRLPVDSAIVHLSQQSDQGEQHYLIKKTDESGQLSLPWPPAGTSFEGWSLMAQHPLEGVSQRVNLPHEAVPDPQQVELEAGSSFKLRVQDGSGNPIPDLQVRLRGMQLAQQRFVAQLMTSPRYLDRAGEYEWTQLPQGEYELSMRSPIGVGWLSRRLHIGPGPGSLDWTVNEASEPVALAGRLLQPSEGFWEFPIANHYVELIDAATGELIAGTRTDSGGRFRLFGEATGEVILLTNELESRFNFGSTRHRYSAGRTDVLLEGEGQALVRVAGRVLDAASGQPIKGASFERKGTQLRAIIGRTDRSGIYSFEVHPETPYVLKAEGYESMMLNDRYDFQRQLRLKPLL